MELIFDKIYHVLNIITTNFCDDYKLRKKKESDRWLDNIYYVYWKKKYCACHFGIGSCTYRKRVFVCFSKYCDIANN